MDADWLKCEGKYVSLEDQQSDWLSGKIWGMNGFIYFLLANNFVLNCPSQ